LLLGISQPKPAVKSKSTAWVASALSIPIPSYDPSRTPDVIGKTIREGQRIMQLAGYQSFSYKSGDDPREVAEQSWLVVGQDPLPGAEIVACVVTLIGVRPDRFPR
jgi:hypothetical protein